MTIDTIKEGMFKVATRDPNPCGHPLNLQAGREPAQSGWYEWAAKKIKEDRCETVLDVGCGMGIGTALLKGTGAEVLGIDIDSSGFSNFVPDLLESDIEQEPDNSFDAVVSIEVIEHILYDREHFENLKRVAKSSIFITTPNYTRSEAHNQCHAREYTLQEALKFFSPDELWVGSPDGFSHVHCLLKKVESLYGNCYRDVSNVDKDIYNVEDIKDDTFVFSDNGLAWPCLAMICNI
jgi:SAM-dependent methyltransferase